MMKKLQLLITCALMCLCVGVGFAQTKATLQLKQYYSATCQSYTGTWNGFYTDPTDLIANGGPWPVQVSLSDQNGVVYGVIDKNLSQPMQMVRTHNINLWATCQHGKLSNIFYGNTKACGAVSQQGMLISKNVLVMQIHFENAMNGTDFWLFLRRANTEFPYVISSTAKEFNPLKVTSCH